VESAIGNEESNQALQEGEEIGSDLAAQLLRAEEGMVAKGT
jgi:hypothetical protein